MLELQFIDLHGEKIRKGLTMVVVISSDTFFDFLRDKGADLKDRAKGEIFKLLLERVMRYVVLYTLEAPDIVLENEKKLVFKAISMAQQDSELWEKIEKYFEKGVVLWMKKLIEIKERETEDMLTELLEEIKKGNFNLYTFDYFIKADYANLKRMVLDFNEISLYGKLSEETKRELLLAIEDFYQKMMNKWSSLLKKQIPTN